MGSAEPKALGWFEYLISLSESVCTGAAQFPNSSQCSRGKSAAVL